MRESLALVFLAAFATALFQGEPVLAKAGKFIGNESCQECHKEIYASWKESMHAKVFDLLEPGVRKKEKLEAGLKPETDYRKDKSCMNCHVTGLDNGGFSFDDPKDEWKGIGCEECHGPAEKWLKLHEKKDVKYRERKLKHAGMVQPFRGKTVCGRCHYHRDTPYKYRDPNRERDWTDPKFAETYHLLNVEPKK